MTVKRISFLTFTEKERDKNGKKISNKFNGVAKNFWFWKGFGVRIIFNNNLPTKTWFLSKIYDIARCRA